MIPCCPGKLETWSNRRKSEKALQKNPDALAGMEGIHFHTLCEQNSDDLEKTLNVVEEKFGFLMQSDSIKWVNFGGGHHITKG